MTTKRDRIAEAISPYLGRQFLVQFKSGPERGLTGTMIARDDMFYTFDAAAIRDETTDGFMPQDSQVLVPVSNVEWLNYHNSSPVVKVVE